MSLTFHMTVASEEALIGWSSPREVSWQCNQSVEERINRRATQIDTPSYPKQLHPPALMLPQDTFPLPVMSPWQTLKPINKHFQVFLTHPYTAAFSLKLQKVAQFAQRIGDILY